MSSCSEPEDEFAVEDLEVEFVGRPGRAYVSILDYLKLHEAYLAEREKGRMRKEWIKGLGILIVVGLILGVAVGIPLATKGEVTFKVNRLERVQDDTGSKYLVYTDEGVFENTDSLIFFKWNSSDLYNELEEGGTYTCTVTGFRIPLISSYRNLIDCEEDS